jgi:hypothetical protein
MLRVCNCLGRCTGSKYASRRGIAYQQGHSPEPVVPLLRDALTALGYVEGRNLRLEFRFAEGQTDRFPELAAALSAEKAEVIVRSATPRRMPRSRQRA